MARFVTLSIVVCALVLLTAASPAMAQPARAAHAAPSAPLNQSLDLKIDNVGSISAPLQIILLLTFLTFVPAILVTMTSFTRIVIVFHFLRQALGTGEMPSNQILIGLALFLTIFIMAPVGDKVSTLALQPAMDGKISINDAVGRATPPVREFMLRQTREKDLAVFVELGKLPKPNTPDELPMRVVIPAYVISELKTGFQMGFFLFIPFLLIDLVVSTTLLSMGMMQLPPAMISLPFKVMLFVMIDGWNLIVVSVVRSFS
jgi:flagellar biosynthetic protein FliP